jgi:ligand-binding sensor domain-containing protein
MLVLSLYISGCGEKKSEKAKEDKIVIEFNNFEFYKNSNLLEITDFLLEDEEPWLITTTKGLFIKNGNGKFKKINLLDNYSKKSNCLMKDSMGKIYVGTPDGLYESSTGKIFMKHNIGYINDVISDKNGNIWCATRTGLKRLRGKDVKVFKRGKTSIPHDTITCFAKTIVDKQEGGAETIFAGTAQGVVKINGNGTFSVYTGTTYVALMNGGMSERPGNTGMEGNTISKMVFVSNNMAFIGTNKGINKTMGFNSFKTFSGDSDEPAADSSGSIVYRKKSGNSPLLSNFIRTLYFDENKIFIGTKKGINILNIETEEWETIKRGKYGFKGGSVNVIKPVGDGFFVGTTRGISKLTKKVIREEEK